MNQRYRKNTKKTSAGSGLQNISPKTMAAVVLMSVMGILWARVLFTGKTGPGAANAATQEQQLAEAAAVVAATQGQSPAVRIERVQLPVLPGRNDVITHNPFSSENWTAFTFHEQEEPEVVEVVKAAPENTVEKRHQANIKAIQRRMTLEGVICDSNDVPYQAFVDGKIFSAGAKLVVKEGPDEYELELKTIEEKKVLFVWNDLTVVLNLAETVEH